MLVQRAYRYTHTLPPRYGLSRCGWSPAIGGPPGLSVTAIFGLLVPRLVPLLQFLWGAQTGRQKPLYDYLSACCIFSMAQFLMLKCNLLVFVQKTLSALSRWAGLSYFYQTCCNILIFVLSQQLTTLHQVRSKGAMLSKWIEYQVCY